MPPKDYEVRHADIGGLKMCWVMDPELQSSVLDIIHEQMTDCDPTSETWLFYKTLLGVLT